MYFIFMYLHLDEFVSYCVRRLCVNLHGAGTKAYFFWTVFPVTPSGTHGQLNGFLIIVRNAVGLLGQVTADRKEGLSQT